MRCRQETEQALGALGDKEFEALLSAAMQLQVWPAGVLQAQMSEKASTGQGRTCMDGVWAHSLLQHASCALQQDQAARTLNPNP